MTLRDAETGRVVGSLGFGDDGHVAISHYPREEITRESIYWHPLAAPRRWSSYTSGDWPRRELMAYDLERVEE